jgi:predicted DNA-binding WGR domain protein
MAEEIDVLDALNVLVLERVDRAKNMASYYVLSIELTLFSESLLVRHWGRVGDPGRTRIDLHPSRRSRVSRSTANTGDPAQLRVDFIAPGAPVQPRLVSGAGGPTHCLVTVGV